MVGLTGNPNTCKGISEQMLWYVRCAIFILAEGCRINVIAACMCTCPCAYIHTCVVNAYTYMHIFTHVHMHIYAHFKYMSVFLYLSTEEEKFILLNLVNIPLEAVKNLLSRYLSKMIRHMKSFLKL